MSEAEADVPAAEASSSADYVVAHEHKRSDEGADDENELQKHRSWIRKQRNNVSVRSQAQT